MKQSELSKAELESIKCAAERKTKNSKLISLCSIAIVLSAALGVGAVLAAGVNYLISQNESEWKQEKQDKIAALAEARQMLAEQPETAHIKTLDLLSKNLKEKESAYMNTPDTYADYTAPLIKTPVVFGLSCFGLALTTFGLGTGLVRHHENQAKKQFLENKKQNTYTC